MTDTGKDAAGEFIARWSGVAASELSTAQSFALDLCRLLEVPAPHPDAEQQYMFERPITFAHGDGSTSAGRIDLYKRGCFVLEAKKVKAATHTRGFDDAMLRARAQAEQYARALPASESRPPFLIVVDVGNRIELYSEFSRSGATYTPFPDPRSHRIALADLANADIRERLRRVWADPLALDPARASARVTREIAARLAELAKSLERAKHSPEAVAQFLMRCLFTMFAEDVGLLPADAFLTLLSKHKNEPDVAMRMLGGLWNDMDKGGFSMAIAADVLRFNGKLFKAQDTLPLDREQIALLIEAAKAKWEHVEPAIFGTLLERALDPAERHKLGAHYTPRAYVERLVLPTIIEPLRKEWEDVKAAVLLQIAEAEQARERGLGSKKAKSQAERLKQSNIELRKARDVILGFHKRLCAVRVLDPACGTGNFLYVALEHLKRLEGEVLNALEEFGLSRLGVTEQTSIDVHGERVIAEEAQTVDPHNLLGIEVNPRAAAIAEVVLWIGYLQWHYRTRGNINPPQPVVRDFRNIECRDAVLAYDTVEYVSNERGIPVTRWDGKTYKTSPVTGEEIPDDSARVPLERYVNPRKAAWPQADFVVGNPPFIGNKRMRLALGDGYVEALRGAWQDVPGSADFVMYWWQHAALLARSGGLQRFGLITTNSIRQAFNRRVVEAALGASLPPPGEGARRADEGKLLTPPPAKSRSKAPSSGATRHLLPVGEGKIVPLSLVFAIPDHPWVDTADGAAVRIAMTVARPGNADGVLCEVIEERDAADGEVAIALRERRGRLFADLKIGANVASALALHANEKLSNRGVIPHGEGMVVTEEEARALGLGAVAGIEKRLRPYRNGRDLTQTPRGVRAIDMFGLGTDEVLHKFPAIYQWLLERVKPERDQNPRASRRENWWVFGENQPKMRESIRGLPRYIATVQTSKHRFFVFLDADVLPDDKLIAIGSDDAALLGVLSSAVHVTWALAAGARLGVGNDPVYNKSTCFECFPFPTATEAQQPHIRNLAEQLDAHRKRQQAAHPDLTLTGMYNVLEKLRSGDVLTAKERTIHEHGLVSVLRQLHDEIDAAVLDAYGWSDLLALLRVAHGNILLPPGGGAPALIKDGADEGDVRNRLPKAPLPDETLAFARELRRTQTDAEKFIWQLLRDRRLLDCKFRRQHPHPPYTLDFFCDKLKLAVELDGSQHADSTRDRVRDERLAEAGIEVIRYWNHDVLARTESVLEDLYEKLQARAEFLDQDRSKAPSSGPSGHLLPVGEGKAEAKRAFDEAILERLVALNAERAAEEARGLVRWLRPDFQNPSAQTAPQQAEMETDTSNEAAMTKSVAAAKPLAWPKDTLAQVRAVADLLAAAPVPLSIDDIAARFSTRGPWKKRLPQLLEMLVALGRVRERAGRYSSN